ncbi:DUF4376 domain-containing protein [Fusibacter ferrireducens]|uniref:DUF4376 domain-containing protein n=1 Tax=Fusibacter ferrireducens TaxID=2785058 RepID=A0ABR9ZT28_9FIRM|nr:hypothetical protein [Fusibacter ferrireducens]MBF4693628.1 hypothetical protein [Fusibacter ferrireducens]
MKYYLAEIDDLGMFVRDVEFDEIPKIQIEQDGALVSIPDPKYQRRCTEGGFHHPRWNGQTYVEGKTIFTEVEINAQKEAAIQKARQACNARILAGFESTCLGESKHFDCEYTDQSTIQGLVITAMLGIQGHTTEACYWKASGELECYPFEYAQMIQLGTDMKNHIQTNIDQFNEERKVILDVYTV